VYGSWSDGGAQSHSINCPAYNTTYTVSFTTQYYLTMTAGSGGSVSPANGWYNAGQGVGISATPNQGDSFTAWTGSGAGSYAGTNQSATVTMNGPLGETAAFSAPPPLTITTASPLYDGTLSTAYNAGFAATGGTGSYTWSLYSGSLPQGLTLSSGGALSTGSGTLRMAGSYAFTVMVTDSGSHTATQNLTLNVDVPSVLTTLLQLQDCIGASGGTMGYGMTCQLAPQFDGSGNPLPYDVAPFTDLSGNRQQQLTIGRSGYIDQNNQPHWLIIEGATAAGNNDAILRRAASSISSGSSTVAAIMTPSSSDITLVWIQYLTFDGNRYAGGAGGQGISCILGQNILVDLNLVALDNLNPYGMGGIFTVWYVDFINAPDTALQLGGQANTALGLASTVDYSNFSQGGWGIGANGGAPSQETAPQSAARFTAAYLTGNSGAYFNTISYAGTAAITLEGSNQYVYGNNLTENRYEQSDGSPGGQLTLWTGFIEKTDSMSAAVASNTINGNCWPGTLSASGTCVQGSGTPVTNCPAFQGVNGSISLGISPGMEVNGWGHNFYNNEVENTGLGMAINLVNSTCSQGFPLCCPPPQYGPTSKGCKEGQIAITSNNPWNTGDSPKFIEQNTSDGIKVFGPPENYNSFQGIILDNLLVRANAWWGVELEAVSVVPSYTGFINGACMYPNSQTQQNGLGTATSSAPPTGASPNLLSGYSSLVVPGQTGYLAQLPGFLTALQSGCPNNLWPAQAPAAWISPGWPY